MNGLYRYTSFLNFKTQNYHLLNNAGWYIGSFENWYLKARKYDRAFDEKVDN